MPLPCKVCIYALFEGNILEDVRECGCKGCGEGVAWVSDDGAEGVDGRKARTNEQKECPIGGMKMETKVIGSEAD